ncbi:MAG: aquaporin [Verrucomicrobiota bacterium]
MRNKLIAEFIGTYFLYVIIGACNFPPGAGEFTPIAVAIGLAALVYSCGHISKAHFNPATTVTYFCAGTHEAKAILPYFIVIFIGAITAALTLPFLYPDGLETIALKEPEWSRVLIAEFLFTFSLMWVILNVAIAQGTRGNAFYGIAIGSIVGAGAYAVGPISFAAFNPAVTLALCINGFLSWTSLMPYAVVQILAAIAAGLLFKSMQITSKEELV